MEYHFSWQRYEWDVPFSAKEASAGCHQPGCTMDSSSSFVPSMEMSLTSPTSLVSSDSLTVVVAYVGLLEMYSIIIYLSSCLIIESLLACDMTMICLA